MRSGAGLGSAAGCSEAGGTQPQGRCNVEARSTLWRGLVNWHALVLLRLHPQTASYHPHARTVPELNLVSDEKSGRPPSALTYTPRCLLSWE